MKKRTRFLSVLMAAFLLLTAFPFGVSAAHGDVVDEFEGRVGEEGGYIEFVPERTGWYGIYTKGGDSNTYGFLCDADNNELDFAYDNYMSDHFYLKGYLEAGETYYIYVFLEEYKYYSPWVTVVIEETIGVVAAEIIQDPADTSIYEGMEEDSIHFADLRMQFSMSDGTYVDWSYDDYSDIYYSPVEWDFFYDEDGNILVEDGKVPVWIGCDDVYDVIDFDLEYNPVKSIKVTCTPIYLYENLDGIKDYDNGYFHYEYELPEDTEVIINYKDGTSVVAKPGDVIDGNEVNVLDYQQHHHWYPDQENYIFIEHMDVVESVPVTIIPDLIMDFEITKLPDKVEYESGYYVLWEGAELTVWYKDGSEKTFALSDENLEYDVEIGNFIVRAGEYKINIRRDMGNEESYIIYWGHSDKAFAVNNLPNGIEVNDARKIADMTVNQVSESGKGTVVEVEYTTGEKEAFEFDVVDYYYEFDENAKTYSRVKGWVKTQNGYADYTIEPVYDEDNILIGYDLYFLNHCTFVQADAIIPEPEEKNIFGDSDCNGKVNIKDATTVQKHVAGIIVLPEVGEALADVDASGAINVKDATAIQKYVAGFETGLPIGDAVN